MTQSWVKIGCVVQEFQHRHVYRRGLANEKMSDLQDSEDNV
jgi:hypothetical protein